MCCCGIRVYVCVRSLISRGSLKHYQEVDVVLIQHFRNGTNLSGRESKSLCNRICHAIGELAGYSDFVGEGLAWY